ncbi:tol-pal system YbgF family protein [Fibrobacter sp. UWEL]|uniref:tetratricopeptide repeat protein n=1 Tax=Fibrobacter sp. UWEL TaxID=1896209 RepID=UPI00091F57A3|nr:tetratricopeptide repeat protein [Fibrobacter sp. UWEL]SHL37237.1 TolA-binding protein [Fibrobacter sp. UWEL]
MKRLARGIVSLAVLTFALTGCSQITMLRTQEIQDVGTNVQKSVGKKMNSAVAKLTAQNDSLRAALDSANYRLDSMMTAATFAQKRMQAEITMLSRRVADESERNDSRQEEIIYRLDMLLGKSDKILAKKVVVSGAPAPISLDSLEREAEKLVEAEAMFNTARSDYHRGEFKLAFTGFKQVYETMKTGELAENSLYWMALCLIDVNQIDKAKKVFNNMTETFPEGQKTCPALFKMSLLYSEECDTEKQKAYLQKILSSKHCEKSAEFEQAAEILQEILEKEEKAAAGEPVEACVPKERVALPAAPQAAKQNAPQAASETPVDPAAAAAMPAAETSVAP